MNKLNKTEFNLAVIFTLLQVTHVLDFTVMIPLASIFIKDFSLSAVQYSYLVASYNISSGLITLCAGNLIDVSERKKFLIISYVGFIIATFLCALSESYSTLLISRIIAGAFGGLTTTATFAFLGDQIREKVRGEATGIVMSSFAITSVFGIPLGLHIATTYHWKMVFMLIVAVSLIVLAISIKVIPRVAAARIEKLSLKQTLNNYKKILSQKNEFYGLILISIVSMSSFLIIPFIAPYLVGNLALAEIDLKYTYFIGGIFTLMCSRIVGRISDIYGHKKIYIIFAILSIVPGLLITHLESASFNTIMIIMTLFMTLFSSRFIPIMSLMNYLPQKEFRGIYFSLSQSIRTLSVAFAAWLAGSLVTVNSNARVEGFEYNGWISVGLILLSFWILKKIKI